MIENDVPQQLDITAPKMVQIEWDQARKVFYAHVDGYTALRMCRVDNIDFVGLRQPPLANNQSIDEKVTLAQDAFWSVVAALHPEITTGDLDPITQAMFDAHCKQVIETWVRMNS